MSVPAIPNITSTNILVLLTSNITAMLVHKVLDCVQVAIGTGQREWSVTSLVDWLCEHTSVLNDEAIDVQYNAYF